MKKIENALLAVFVILTFVALIAAMIPLLAVDPLFAIAMVCFILIAAGGMLYITIEEINWKRKHNKEG